MTEQQAPLERDIKTESGNYSERINGHYIQANQVIIHEQPPCLSINNGVSATTKVDKKHLAFAIAGSIDEIDKSKLKAILALLQKISGDASIEIIDIQEGSIKLILNGSPEGLERLKKLFDSGELNEILDTPVKYVHFLNETEKIKLDEKSRLIQEIREKSLFIENNGQNLNLALLTEWINLDSVDELKFLIYYLDSRINYQHIVPIANENLLNDGIKYNLVKEIDEKGAKRKDLNGVDLSGVDLRCLKFRNAKLKNANLSHTNLSSTDFSLANLSNTNLSNSNLSNADLRYAKLYQTNLSFTNLSGANLCGAEICFANLSNADLSNAKVLNAHFVNNVGISNHTKKDLIQKGAIFDDSPGDCASILA